MLLDDARVCQCVAPEAGGGHGHVVSGYLVDDGRVQTTAHDLGDLTGLQAWYGRDGWQDVERVLWDGRDHGCDLLLAVPGLHASGPAPSGGSRTGPTPAADATGFSVAQDRRERRDVPPGAAVRDTEHLVGHDRSADRTRGSHPRAPCRRRGTGASRGLAGHVGGRDGGRRRPAGGLVGQILEGWTCDRIDLVPVGVMLHAGMEEVLGRLGPLPTIQAVPLRG